MYGKTAVAYDDPKKVPHILKNGTRIIQKTYQNSNAVPYTAPVCFGEVSIILSQW